jgi:acid phosphatase (class A)
MMAGWRRPVIAVILLAFGATAPQAARLNGYLAPGSFDILKVLPPAPKPGDPAYQTDRDTFHATRSLLNLDRGDLATNDVGLSEDELAADFSCALGFRFDPHKAPATMRLLTRAEIDDAHAVIEAKGRYRRLRPFQIDAGPTCQPIDNIEGNPDYPSGHAAYGWTWATLLSELDPERSEAILARGKAYGESRIVCGVHNASAVEAGRVTALSTFGAMKNQPSFRSDLGAAQQEFDTLRAHAHDLSTSRHCAAENALVVQPILPILQKSTHD